MKFYVTGITNRKGRFRILDVTKEGSGWCLHLNEGNVLTCTNTSVASLKFTVDGGTIMTWIGFVFRYLEKEKLSKMDEPEKAKYLLTYR